MMKDFMIKNTEMSVISAVNNFAKAGYKVNIVAIWDELNDKPILFDWSWKELNEHIKKYFPENNCSAMSKVSYSEKDKVLCFLWNSEKDTENKCKQKEELMEAYYMRIEEELNAEKHDTKKRIAKLYSSLTEYSDYEEFIERCEEFNLESEKCSFEQYVNWYNQTWICEYNKMFKTEKRLERCLNSKQNCIECKHYYETEDETGIHSHCRVEEEEKRLEEYYRNWEEINDNIELPW